MRRYVGLDLSLTSTGIALIETDGDVQRLSVENVKTKGTKKDTWQQRRDRLFAIANEVVAIAEDSAGAETFVAVEGPSYGSMHGAQHDRSGLWWLVVNALMAGDLPVAVVSPQGRAKYGTGKGNSSKDVVLAHVRERYTDLLGKRIANDDIGDAILLADLYARRNEDGLWVDVPEDNLLALDGVLWPTV